jgi:MFS family permease
MTICAIAGTVAMLAVILITNIPSLLLYFLMFLLGFASAGQTLSFALIKDNNAPSTNSAANGFNNMIVVAGGILFQPLIGKILDLLWDGSMIAGVRNYNLHNYQIGFLLLPICYLIAAIASALLIKETNCIATWENK